MPANHFAQHRHEPLGGKKVPAIPATASEPGSPRKLSRQRGEPVALSDLHPDADHRDAGNCSANRYLKRMRRLKREYDYRHPGNFFSRSPFTNHVYPTALGSTSSG